MTDATALSLLWAGLAVVFGAVALVILARRATPPVAQPGPGALSDEADRFMHRVLERMDAAEGEIRDLKTQVRDLTQENIQIQRREIEWQRIYLMLVDQRQTLLDQLIAMGANFSPPPPPPPPPEGSGGGYLTGPSPRPRQVPSGALNDLLDILSATILAGPVSARDVLLTGMPPGWRQSLHRPPAARADLADMIERAALHGGNPPLLEVLLGNIESSLGLGSDPQERVRQWRLRNRW